MLLAEGELAAYQVAEQCEISRSTLLQWQGRKPFVDRVEENRRIIRDGVRNHGIAVIENRVKRLQRDWMKMQQVITERGDTEEMKNVPGGTTGLLVKQIKGIGKGDDFRVVEMYVVDGALLAELRAHEHHAAKELQQWTDKVEQRIDQQQLDALIELELAKLAAGSEDGVTEPLEGEEPEE